MYMNFFVNFLLGASLPDVFVYIIESLLVWHIARQYYSYLFGFSGKLAVPFFLTIILFIAPLLAPIPQVQCPVLFLFVLTYFIAGRRCYHLKWKNALIHAGLTAVMMTLSEHILSEINYQMSWRLGHGFSTVIHTISLSALSILLYFLVLLTAVYFLIRRKIRPDFFWKNLLMIAIPVLSVSVLWTIYANMNLYDSRENIDVVLMSDIGEIIITLINFLVFRLFYQMENYTQKYASAQLQAQKEHDLVSYYSLLLKQDETHKILIHDIKNHLQAIADLNSRGERDKIASYIEHLSRSSDLAAPVRLCDNEQLNAVLSRYVLICKEQSIQFHADIRSGLLTDFPYEDIAALFCNLLDNSVEAASGIPDSYIELSITRPRDDSPVVVALFNTCRDNPFDPVTGELVSHKESAGFHGIGVKSIERVVGKHGGKMTMYYNREKREFHTVISF